MARYRFVQLRNHPLQPEPRWRTVPEHRLVLWDKIGYGPHLCHWCGDPINWKVGGRTAPGVLTVDHEDNNSRNNDPANLVPACHRCNSRRGHPLNVADNEVFIVRADGRHRAVLRTCEWCGIEFPYIAAQANDPKRGRFCSRSHARLHDNTPRDTGGRR